MLTTSILLITFPEEAEKSFIKINNVPKFARSFRKTETHAKSKVGKIRHSVKIILSSRAHRNVIPSLKISQMFD